MERKRNKIKSYKKSRIYGAQKKRDLCYFLRKTLSNAGAMCYIINRPYEASPAHGLLAGYKARLVVLFGIYK